jgi:DNA-binding NtrC family response regulator
VRDGKRRGGPAVLLVDGDPLVRRRVAPWLAAEGFTPVGAACAAEARALAARRPPALAIVEMVLPDGDGLTLLEGLDALVPGLPAVVLTAYAEPRSIVEAMRRGALDYLPKPPDREALLAACRAALPAPPPATPRQARPLPPLVGESPATLALRATLSRLARARLAGALLVGEDGVGKTWIARWLHAASGRQGAPCLLLPAGPGWAPEVALFGARRGGGSGSGPGGLAVAAAGGTLILDDVDRLAPEVGRRLLDHVERAGRAAPLLVGLTTDAEVPSPLLGWLGRVSLAVAPLRERSGDVVPLARLFVERAARRLGRRPPALARRTETALLGHAWPGNVRELAWLLERAVRLAAGPSLEREHLAAAWHLPGGPPPWADPDLRPLREVEQAYIEHVLAATRGNRTRAARLLGVARETLRCRLRHRAAS